MQLLMSDRVQYPNTASSNVTVGEKERVCESGMRAESKHGNVTAGQKERVCESGMREAS